MKNFKCTCGQILYFENTRCLNCERQVGFDPVSFTMRSLPRPDESSSEFENATDADSAVPVRLCRNSADYDVCNWLVTEADESYCVSCRLNHTIPNLMLPKRRRWWKSMEYAKRRLIYSLLSLNLPVLGKQEDAAGLAFEFIEDQRTNPGVYEEHVNTGHNNGLITINVAEADHVSRAISRQFTGELYRTLLGHFRHEIGHYYFGQLVSGDETIARFRELFGDEREDYSAALERYYANKATMERDPDAISHYAQSHPLEDWAEVWAHYLHMVDTMDTAGEYNMQQGSTHFDDIDEMLIKWSQLTMVMNALNRSMGLEDAYPFFLSELTKAKLRFVHGLICPSSEPRS